MMILVLFMGWSYPLNLSRTAESSHLPTIDTYGDSIFVVWDENHLKDANMYCAFYDGKEWHEAERITNYENADNFALGGPFVVVDRDGVVHVFWDYEQMYIVWMYNNGNGWSEPVQVTTSMTAQSPFAIVDRDNRIYLFWHNIDFPCYIFYRVYEGGVWGEQDTIDFPEAGCIFGARGVVDSKNRLHLVWVAAERGIYYTVYDNGEWEDGELLWGKGDVRPDICVDDNDVPYMVWAGVYNGHNAVYFSKKEGGAWTAPFLLSDSEVNSYLPYISISGDTVCVIWVDEDKGAVSRFFVEGEWSEVIEMHSPGLTYDITTDYRGVFHAVLSGGRDWDVYYTRYEWEGVLERGGGWGSGEGSKISFDYISYVIREGGIVEVIIYDSGGRVIRRDKGYKEAGEYRYEIEDNGVFLYEVKLKDKVIKRGKVIRIK